MRLFNHIMANKKKIYHRNDARPALSGLSLPARRILYLTIVQQDKDSNGNVVFDENKVYTITAKEYADLCDVDLSVAYKQLHDGVKEIRACLMKVPEDEVRSMDKSLRRPKDGMILFTVANYGYYSDGGGFIEIKLDPIIAPYISNLKKNFTGQLLLSGLRLPDGNANRLYLLLREWISSGMSMYMDIAVDELKRKLLVSDLKTYNLFNDFNKLFFKRAAKTIVETTEFSKLNMEIIERRKRKAHRVRVSYEYEEQKKHMKNARFAVGTSKTTTDNDSINTEK